MTKTANYNLNKPEATDPLRLADFNDNADIIDTALAGLTSRLKIEFGSYVGTGTFGTGTKNTLTFPFPPKVVIVVADAQGASHPGALFLAGQQYSNGFGVVSAYGQYGLTLTWGENTLSWTSRYGSSNGADAYWQLNASGVTYRYVVIG